LPGSETSRLEVGLRHVVSSSRQLAAKRQVADVPDLRAPRVASWEVWSQTSARTASHAAGGVWGAPYP
jgi:hypothetical protein